MAGRSFTDTGSYAKPFSEAGSVQRNNPPRTGHEGNPRPAVGASAGSNGPKPAGKSRQSAARKGHAHGLRFPIVRSSCQCASKERRLRHQGTGLRTAAPPQDPVHPLWNGGLWAGRTPLEHTDLRLIVANRRPWRSGLSAQRATNRVGGVCGNGGRANPAAARLLRLAPLWRGAHRRWVCKADPGKPPST